MNDGGLSWLRKSYQRMKEQAEREQRSLHDMVAERYGVRTNGTLEALTHFPTCHRTDEDALWCAVIQTDITSDTSEGYTLADWLALLRLSFYSWWGVNTCKALRICYTDTYIYIHYNDKNVSLWCYCKAICVLTTYVRATCWFHTSTETLT